MTTFLTMQTELQLHLRQRTGLLTSVKQKLNEAVLEVMLLAKPPEFYETTPITTVAGTSAYDLTAQSNNILAVVGVTIDGTSTVKPTRLSKGNYREFDEQHQTADTRGRPHKWFRFGQEIIFYDKVPDAVYTITVRHLERPTVLSADADVFPLPLEWEEPVILRAAAKMFTLLGNAERKGLADQLFNEAVGFVIDRVGGIENSGDHDAGMRAGTHSLKAGRGGGGYSR
jgi:hypothetical protein